MGRLIRRNDLWALAAFALWLTLLLAGFCPDWTFRWLRDATGVLPHRAVVNNPLAVSVALSIYLAIFVWHRCMEENAPRIQAKAHSLQMAFLGAIAFAPIATDDFIRIWLMADEAQRANALRIVGSLAVAKIFAWFYLVSLFARYYLGHNYRVFADMVTLIPSARQRPATTHETPDAAEAAQQSAKE